MSTNHRKRTIVIETHSPNPLFVIFRDFTVFDTVQSVSDSRPLLLQRPLYVWYFGSSWVFVWLNLFFRTLLKNRVKLLLWKRSSKQYIASRRKWKTPVRLWLFSSRSGHFPSYKKTITVGNGLYPHVFSVKRVLNINADRTTEFVKPFRSLYIK